ncbi:Spastin [Hordeum vulgare]|nr:Spastin [Hordeum vulgare]
MLDGDRVGGGVVMLELVTGLRPVDVDVDRERRDVTLADWVEVIGEPGWVQVNHKNFIKGTTTLLADGDEVVLRSQHHRHACVSFSYHVFFLHFSDTARFVGLTIL